jgi:hypothetical protein
VYEFALRTGNDQELWHTLWQERLDLHVAQRKLDVDKSLWWMKEKRDIEYVETVHAIIKANKNTKKRKREAKKRKELQKKMEKVSARDPSERAAAAHRRPPSLILSLTAPSPNPPLRPAGGRGCAAEELDPEEHDPERPDERRQVDPPGARQPGQEPEHAEPVGEPRVRDFVRPPRARADGPQERP